MTGLILGIVPAFLVFSLFSTSKDIEPETNFDIELLANADGVRKTLSKETPVILNIDVIGAIGLSNLSQSNINDILVESREGVLKNNRVKALFLTIESPGGTVTDSDGIYRAIKAYKEKYKVPVYAFVDGMCASGAMYIACAADKVYATDASIIGSVGVLSPSFLNLSDLINKIGVKALTLTAGKGKDEMNPLRPWAPGEQDVLQTIINNYYSMFTGIVLNARPEMDKKKLVDEYGAHVFSADIAAKHGFIDGSGQSRNDVLKMLLKQLDIKDDHYLVVRMKSTKWWKSLFSESAMSFLFKGKVKHEIDITGELPSELQGQFLYLYRG
jgi:signal peptide peptidase SppA